MENKICCFAGHSTVYIEDLEQISEIVSSEITNLIENHNVNTFYNGGKGTFDNLCAECVANIRQYYKTIESYLILAYMPKNDGFNSTLYDGTIYPELETVPPKFAIIRRNEWIIDNSNFLIAYVKNQYGGAYRTLKYAQRKKHIIIRNIA